MDHLFSPYSIKQCTFKNRIVMPGLASFLIEDDGTITHRTIEHYRMRAAGGAAMVIMEACTVSPEGLVSPHQARIYDDRFIEGLSKIAGAIKGEGAVPGLQLHHAGRQTSIRIIKQKPLAPSSLPCPRIRGDVEPLTVDGIQELIRKFGDGAARAVEAGFELIEIHGAHGYLVNQFLSTFSNVRDDGYGGDVSGRTRFAAEIVREIRDRVGMDMPISFKISAQEFVPNGITVDESIDMLRILADESIDVAQISAGNDATPEWISQPMYMEKACLADSAGRIKKALNIPIMSVGRINDPHIGDRIIREGKADLVCIGRGLLADPELPKKAKDGRFDEIRICIACNTCMESIWRKGRVECMVNPTLGREKEMAIQPARVPRKVMVIGGGPAGLNLAWVAAVRGHDVHLFEKNAFLGGQLILGSVSPYKTEIKSLIEFLTKQVEKTDVKCHTCTDVTVKTIKDINPDVVVLATGSTPIAPPIKGIENRSVISFNEILNGNRPSPKKTVIIGGGSTGCELALYLKETGSDVTMLEMLPKIASNMESISRKVLVQKLDETDVTIITECEVSFITDTGVLINKDGREIFIKAERVVIAAGTKPNNSLYGQIKSLGYEVHQIGDCMESRNAKAALYEAAVLGRTI